MSRARFHASREVGAPSSSSNREGNAGIRDCRFLRGGFERLEPYDGKLSRTVLRGACGRVTVLWAGNGPRLPGFSVPSALSATAAGYLGRPTNAADAEDRAADLKRSTARLSFPH